VKKHFIKLLNSNKKQKCLRLRLKIQVLRILDLVGLVKYFWKGISTLVPNEKKIFFWAESEVDFRVPTENSQDIRDLGTLLWL